MGVSTLTRMTGGNTVEGGDRGDTGDTGDTCDSGDIFDRDDTVTVVAWVTQMT